ncbi:hypothetical protein LX59_02829 [Azomonas agilis]|uniref:Uncharacterized protein n=1 Tax=Azomonas agilis TaxID=116849 RepID=A0A562I038_9GAMM|nr:hypothetical protein [Azomonas agilis]TWH64005.1 hypothetical protein LX59_02829 [Azomonas agilis]
MAIETGRDWAVVGQMRVGVLRFMQQRCVQVFQCCSPLNGWCITNPMMNLNLAFGLVRMEDLLNVQEMEHQLSFQPMYAGRQLEASPLPQYTTPAYNWADKRALTGGVQCQCLS